MGSCMSSDNNREVSSKHASKQGSLRKVASSGKNRSQASLSPEDLSISLAGSNLYIFTFAELQMATGGFSNSNFLGEGGFGPVYKGIIDERVRPGMESQSVAVKLLDLDGLQGHREWLAEVIFLGKLRHPHLVKLIGYCYEDQHRLLVYEYMIKGSLESLVQKILHILTMVNKTEDCSGGCQGIGLPPRGGEAGDIPRF